MKKENIIIIIIIIIIIYKNTSVENTVEVVLMKRFV